jgi:hypothetical protein
MLDTKETFYNLIKYQVVAATDRFIHFWKNCVLQIFLYRIKN